MTTRVEQDGAIIAQVTVEQTRLAALKPAPKDDLAPAFELRRTEQISTRSTVRLASGKPIIVGSQATSIGGGEAQTYILLTATLPEPKPVPAVVEPAADAAPPVELKIMTLTNAQAADLARIIAEVFHGEPFKVGIDERTNSLLLSAPKAVLEKIEPLVIRLDQPK